MTQTQSYSTFVPSHEDTGSAINTGVTVNHNPGTLSTSISEGTGSSSEHKVAQISSSDLSPFAADDWRSTARSPSGGFQTTDITSDTIVEIGGCSATVSAFIQAGIMVKDGDGFALVGQQGEAPKDAGNAQTGPDSVTVTAVQERAANEALAPFSEGTFESCIANGAAIATGAMSMDEVISKAASQSGMDPAEASSRIGVVQQMYQAQADSFVTQAGLHKDDLPEFYDWCRGSGNKEKLAQAVQGQLYQGNMSGYRALIAGYMSANAPSVETLRANGRPTRVLSGVNEVQINGKWWPLTSAARAGLI